MNGLLLSSWNDLQTQEKAHQGPNQQELVGVMPAGFQMSQDLQTTIDVRYLLGTGENGEAMIYSFARRRQLRFWKGDKSAQPAGERNQRDRCLDSKMRIPKCFSNFCLEMQAVLGRNLSDGRGLASRTF